MTQDWAGNDVVTITTLSCRPDLQRILRQS